MAPVGQDGRCILALPEQPGVGVGGAGVGGVAAGLAMPVGRSIASRPCARIGVAIVVLPSSRPLGVKLLWLAQAWIKVPSTEKWSLLSSLRLSARVITSITPSRTVSVSHS